MVLVPTLVVMIFVAATYALEKENRSGRLAADADRAHALLRLEIDEAAESLHAQLDLLADDPVLAAMIAAGDSSGLERRIGPIFTHLRDQHGISHLYFFRPDRSPLLRMDGAGKSGQVVDRLTLFETAESLGKSDGLDLNAFGLLTLRVTVGWRDGSGKLLGFVEIGRDVAPLIDAVHRIMGLDILLLVKKDLLDREKWELGERQSGGQGSWDELSNTVSVARTLATIPAAVGIALEDGLPSTSDGITIVTIGRHSMAMSVQQLIDLEKK